MLMTESEEAFSEVEDDINLHVFLSLHEMLFVGLKEIRKVLSTKRKSQIQTFIG